MSDFPYNTRTHRAEGSSFSVLFFSSIKDGVAELVEGYEFSSSSSLTSTSMSSSLSSLSSTSFSVSSMSSSSLSSDSSSSISSSLSSISLSSLSSESSISSSSLSSLSSSSTEHVCECTGYNWHYSSGVDVARTDKISSLVVPDHVSVDGTCDLWLVVKRTISTHYVWIMTSQSEAIGVANSPSATGSTATTIGWGYGAAPGTIMLTNGGEVALSEAFTYDGDLGTVFRVVCLRSGTLYVATTGDDSNDGLDITRPKQTIQAAVSAARAGYTVRIASGTYVLSSGIVVTEEVYLQGEAAFSTIIDGNNAVRCLDLYYGATASDLTLINGNGEGLDFGVGGAVILSKAKLNRCVVTNCTDGGIFMSGEFTEIINSLVYNNTAMSELTVGGVRISLAGALYGWYGSALISNCTICDNNGFSPSFEDLLITGDGTIGNPDPSIVQPVIANTICLTAAFGATVPVIITSAINGSVVFQDQPNRNYRLDSLAFNCIGQGTNAYASGQAYDLDLRDRIVDYTVDIGAYEYDPLSMLTDVYVSPSGNDTNSGTILSPKRTIPAGVAICLWGGTVHVADGTYVLTAPIILNSSQQYTGKTIVGSNPLTTIIDGDNLGACFEIHGAFELNGLTIQNGSDSGIKIGDSINPSVGDMVILNRCLIKSNSSINGGGVSFVSSGNDSVYIANCLIYDNTASGKGGGVYSNTYRYTFINNSTICDNMAVGGGGGCYFVPNGSAVIGGSNNAILYFNNPNDIGTTNYSLISCRYTCTSSLSGITHYMSITSDPLFANRAMDDYTLLAGSPCVNTGNPSYINGAYGSLDLAGGDRIVGGIVDMGAYERP